MSPQQVLDALPPGRHYGAAHDGQCWTMVGRRLSEVDEWTIVPPLSSLTLAWGAGGCEVLFSGGQFSVGPGDLMWIDAGWGHRGKNIPGSDFLTLMFSPQQVAGAGLHVNPIGAAVAPAPREVAQLLLALSALMLEGQATLLFEVPARDAVLTWVRQAIAPHRSDAPDRAEMAAADDMLCDPESTRRIGDVARAVGLDGPSFSRQFVKAFRMTPELYRKQQRLAVATRALMAGHSVLVAAHDAGFSDSAHFSRTFKRQYGIPPSQWADKVVPRKGA
jgi:AraC-like DNA-binding protein